MSQTKHNQSVKLHVRKGDRVKMIAGKDKGWSVRSSRPSPTAAPSPWPA